MIKIKAKISVAAIIMASGKSSRFANGNKLLQMLNGMTVVETVAQTILQAEEINKFYITTGIEEIEEAVRTIPNLKVLKNMNYKRGISESIKLGVSQAKMENLDGIS